MTEPSEILKRIQSNLDNDEPPLLIWDQETTVEHLKAMDGVSENDFTLTNPPRYAIMTWIDYDDTAVVGLFPKVDPKNPKEKTTRIAVAPDNLSHEELVDIYETLLKVRPDEVVEVQIIHLSNEQVASIIACDYDQDELFAFAYENDDDYNSFFDIITPVLVANSIEDIPKEEMDVILAQQRHLQGAFTRPSS